MQLSLKLQKNIIQQCHMLKYLHQNIININLLQDGTEYGNLYKLSYFTDIITINVEKM